MQTVTIDLIPQDVLPIIKVSQFNDNWDIKFIITENGEEVQIRPDDVCTCVIRKPDNNIVTITATTLYDNGVKISLTEQACACYGKAIGELVITATVGGITKRVGTCNFILDVEMSPEFGGIRSASEIDNLQRQIDAIITQDAGPIVEEIAGPIVTELVPEIIGEDYYNKNAIDQMIDSLDEDINAAFNQAKFYTLAAGDTSISFIISGIQSTDIIDFKVNELNIIMPDITAVAVTGGIQYTLTFENAFDHDISIAFIKYSYNLIT